MKLTGILTGLGVFSLVCGAVGLVVPSPTPPSPAALQRTEATLEVAQPGPYIIPGHRGGAVLGNIPGAWVLSLDVAGAKHRFAIDAPEPARLQRLQQLERNTRVQALVHDGEVWQLENGAGELLVPFEERAASARLGKEQGYRALAWFVGVGVVLIGLGRVGRIGGRKRVPRAA